MYVQKYKLCLYTIKKVGELSPTGDVRYRPPDIYLIKSYLLPRRYNQGEFHHHNRISDDDNEAEQIKENSVYTNFPK